jgi:FixJ family two-component response regulator
MDWCCLYTIVECIRELVDSLGYNTATFMSAEHFLEDGMIAETTCLITDLQMPGLSGLELQQALRSQGYHTPVILITAYPNEKHRTRVLGNGAVGFLTKPFDERLLIIHGHCTSKSQRLKSRPLSAQAARHKTS